MRLKDVNSQKINDAITWRKASAERLTGDNDRLKKEIEEFKRPREERISKNSATISGYGTESEFLAFAAFLQTGIPEGVRHLRKRAGELRVKSASKKITVESAERLRVRLAEAEKDLQAACPHPIVLRTDGYSHPSDCDDSRSGEAQCVVCGFRADDSDYRNNNKQMPNDGTRAVRRIYNEVEYSDRKDSGLDSPQLLRRRVAEYQALPTVDAVVEMFFGPVRMQHLLELIKDV